MAVVMVVKVMSEMIEKEKRIMVFRGVCCRVEESRILRLRRQWG